MRGTDLRRGFYVQGSWNPTHCLNVLGGRVGNVLGTGEEMFWETGEEMLWETGEEMFRETGEEMFWEMGVGMFRGLGVGLFMGVPSVADAVYGSLGSENRTAPAVSEGCE